MASTFTIHVDKLTLDWRVGILDFERTAPQPLYISVDAVLYPIHINGNETHDDVLCYADIVDFITSYRDKGHVDLLETIAHTICTYVLLHKTCDSVSVQVLKPNIIDACHAVGVSCFRKKET